MSHALGNWGTMVRVDESSNFFPREVAVIFERAPLRDVLILPAALDHLRREAILLYVDVLLRRTLARLDFEKLDDLVPQVVQICRRSLSASQASPVRATPLQSTAPCGWLGAAYHRQSSQGNPHRR